MFKKQYTLLNVATGYSVNKQNVYYSTKLNFSIYDLKIERHVKEISNEYDIEFIQVCNDRIYLILDDAVVVLDKELQVKRHQEIGALSKVFGNNKLLTDEGFNVKNFKSRFGLYDFDSDILLWRSDEFRSFGSVNGQDIFMLNFDSIQRVDEVDGEMLWVYVFENPQQNKSPFLLGQIDDLALFGLTDQDKVIALNIDSGELVWETACIPQMSQLYQGNLHSFTGGYVCRDAQTGKDVARFRGEKYTAEVGIVGQRNNFAFVGDHIITTDHLKGRIGAFNTKTFKFDWIHDEPDVFFPSPRPVIYEEPYLLLHDNKDALHIFKKG